MGRFSYVQYKDVEVEDVKKEVLERLNLLKLVFNKSNITSYDDDIEKYKSKIEDIKTLEYLLNTCFHIRAWGDLDIKDEAIKEVFGDKFDYFKGSYLWWEIMHHLKEPIPRLIRVLHLNEIKTGLKNLKQILVDEENIEYDEYIQNIDKWVERMYFKNGRAEPLVDMEQIKNLTFTKTTKEVVEEIIESIKKHIIYLA